MSAPLIFTRRGLVLHRSRLVEAQARARKAGLDTGEQAGLACDWHDNFGFEDARRRLEEASELVRRIDGEIRCARVVDPPDHVETVAVGTSVVLEVDGLTATHAIGGFGESDFRIGVVSYDAPLIWPMLGAREGEERTVRLGGKDKVVTVVRIGLYRPRQSQERPDDTSY